MIVIVIILEVIQVGLLLWMLHRPKRADSAPDEVRRRIEEENRAFSELIGYNANTVYGTEDKS